MSSRSRVVVCGLFCAVLLIACEDSRNRADGLLGVDPATIPALCASPSATIKTDDSPSLSGLDRRAWDLLLVQVPRGQVEVQPTYMRNLRLASGSVRSEGLYPTQATVLDGPATQNSVLVEGIAQPAWAPISLAGSPVQMIRGEWPWSTRREPRGKYELVPAEPTPANAVNWAWVERPLPP